MDTKSLALFVGYLLGDQQYKKTYQFDDYDPSWLEFLEKTHLLTFIPDEAYQHLGQRTKDIASSYLLYQELLEGVYGEVLGNIDQKLASTTTAIALLKGPSTTRLYHPIPYSRLYSDLDLLLVGKESEKQFCESLLDMNFKFLGDDLEGELEALNGYELSTFSREFSLPIDVQTYNRLKYVAKGEGQRMRLINYEPGEILVRVDIEPHLSLFVYEDGRRPKIMGSEFVPVSDKVALFDLPIYTQLCYTATKIYLDYGRLTNGDITKFRFMKLCKDFIEILKRIHTIHVKSAIELASRWRTKEHLLFCLNQFEPFVHSIELELPTLEERDDLILTVIELWYAQHE